MVHDRCTTEQRSWVTKPGQGNIFVLKKHTALLLLVGDKTSITIIVMRKLHAFRQQPIACLPRLLSYRRVHMRCKSAQLPHPRDLGPCEERVPLVRVVDAASAFNHRRFFQLLVATAVARLIPVSIVSIFKRLRSSDRFLKQHHSTSPLFVYAYACALALACKTTPLFHPSRSPRPEPWSTAQRSS